MDPLSQRIKQVSNELKEYVETRIELLILNLSDKSTKWLGDFIQHGLSFLILGAGLLFGLIALGFYLGELLNSTPLGFATIGGFLSIIGLLLVWVKPRGISRRIQDHIMHDVIEALGSEKEHEEIKFLEEKKLEEK